MRYFIFIITFFCIAELQAQYKVTVRDQDNFPLEGASVSYAKTGTTTDARGVATLPNLKKGTLITVSYIGYKSISKKFQGIPLRFILKEQNNILKGITIVNQLPKATPKTPVSYSDINKVAIAKRNLGKGIPLLLEGSPSLVNTSDDGTGIGYSGFRIRGTDANRINVTINGVPLTDAESHGVFWVNTPDIAAATKSLQIQRGVGTSTNGAAAFGATLNLETDDFNHQAYAKVGLSGGSFKTFRQNYQAGTGLIANRFTFDAKYSDIYSSGYVDRAFSDLKSYYAAAGYHGDNFLIRFLAFGGDQTTYQAWSGVPSSMILRNRKYNSEGEYKDEKGKKKYYKNHTDNYKQNHYQLFYSHKLNPYWNISTTLHYTRGKGYYESYKSNRKYKKYNIPTPTLADGSKIEKTDLIQQKWLDNDFYGLITSAQYKKNAWDILIGGGVNQYKGGHYGDVIWAKKGFFPNNYRWYTNDGTKDEFNTYLKASYQISPSFNLYGDLQYRQINYEIKGTHDDLRNISQKHTHKFFNPKFGITYIPNKKLRSFISWGRAQREPSRSSFRDLSPKEAPPTHEQLDDFEAGIRYTTNTFSLSANTYYMLYDNQLISTGKINDVGAYILTNVKDSYRAGIELAAAIKFNEHIRWSGNATFSKNEAKNFTAYVDNITTNKQTVEKIGTTKLAFSPEVIANSNFTIEPIKDLEFTLLSNYVSKQYLDNTANDNRSLDAYFVNNIQISYNYQPKRWFKEIALNMRLNNVGNTKYETNGWVYRYIENGQEKKYDGLFPQAGSHIMLGATFSF